MGKIIKFPRPLPHLRPSTKAGPAAARPSTAPDGAPGAQPLPDDAAARKQIPIATGFLDYFPLAIVEIARLSQIGNDQHNPGQPLHWDRSKSGDEDDAALRHFLQRGTVDKDGVRHRTKAAWRILAGLQKELEAAQAPPDVSA